MIKNYNALPIGLIFLSSFQLQADCGDGANAVNQEFRSAVSTCDIATLSRLLSESSKSNDAEKVIDRSEKNASCARYSQMAVQHWKTGRPVGTSAADLARAAEIDVNCGATIALLGQNEFQIDDPFVPGRSAVVDAVKGSSCLMPAVKLLLDAGTENSGLALVEAKKTREMAFKKATDSRATVSDAKLYESNVVTCDRTIDLLSKTHRPSSSGATVPNKTPVKPVGGTPGL